MRFKLSLVCTLFLGMAIAAAEFTSLDINSALAGSTEDQGHAAYKITGGGADIWNSSDGFRLVYQTISGDFDMRAMISEIAPTNPWAKAGLIVRASTSPSAPHAMMVASASNGFAFQYRSVQGGVTSHKAGGETAFPYSWVRIIRIGNTLAGYKSTDPQGDEWQFVGSIELALADPVLVGMCVTAHDNTKLCAAQFDSVNLNPSVPPVIGSGTGLNVKYFNNTAFTGTPVLSRIDEEVNFNWGTTAPDALVNADNYAVQWSGLVEPQYSEDYTFFTTSDDGVRLWLDGKLLVDNWTDHGPTENRSYPIRLQAGTKYSLVMEYYEKTGGAVAKLAWTSRSTFKEIVPTSQLYPEPLLPAEGDGTGLKGEYFTSRDLTNRALVRMDSTVNFAWGNGSPALLIPNDNFSVRWTGQVSPRFSGTYTFYTQSDDGVRLWVDNQLIVNNWTDHGSTENSGRIALAAGKKYDIRMEYYERTGGTAARLSWSSVHQVKEVIPALQLYPGNGTGFFAEYFDNSDFTAPKFSRVDDKIDFAWAFGSPDARIESDTFSVRWSGLAETKFSENYSFYTVSDEAVRLWINGQLVIDNWIEHAETEDVSLPISLNAGVPFDVKMEFMENAGSATAKLYWSSASQVKQVIPTSQVKPKGGMLVSIPQSSAVSPACIEGTKWSLDGQPVSISYSRNGVSETVADLGPTRFFTNSPLSAEEATSVEFTHSGTGISQGGLITWTPTDVSGKNLSIDQLYLRPGDALLLTGSGEGNSLTIDIDSNGTADHIGIPNQVFPTTFNTAGHYLITARIDGKITGTLLVTVVTVDLVKPIASEVGFKRIKNVVVVPSTAWNGTIFTSADDALLHVENAGPFDNVDGRGSVVYLKPLSRGTPVLIARAGSASGSIIAHKEIDEYTIETEAAIHTVTFTVSDDTASIGTSKVVLRPYIPGLRLVFNMFASSSSFAGGATNFSINTSDENSSIGETGFQAKFDEETQESIGVFEYSLEIPQGEDSYCFSVSVRQSASQEVAVSAGHNNNGKACKLTVSEVIMCKGGSKEMTVSVKEAGKPAKDHKIKVDNPLTLNPKEPTINCGYVGGSVTFTVNSNTAAGGRYNISIDGSRPAKPVITVVEVKFVKKPAKKKLLATGGIELEASVTPSDLSGTWSWAHSLGGTFTPPDNKTTTYVSPADKSNSESDSVTAKFTTGDHSCSVSEPLVITVPYYFDSPQDGKTHTHRSPAGTGVFASDNTSQPQVYPGLVSTTPGPSNPVEYKIYDQFKAEMSQTMSGDNPKAQLGIRENLPDGWSGHANSVKWAKSVVNGGSANQNAWKERGIINGFTDYVAINTPFPMRPLILTQPEGSTTFRLDSTLRSDNALIFGLLPHKWEVTVLTGSSPVESLIRQISDNTFRVEITNYSFNGTKDYFSITASYKVKVTNKK